MEKKDKLFNCSEEGVYYYHSNSVCKCQPSYTVNCPKCGKSLCYFCSKCIKNIHDNSEYCCFKRFICHKYFRDDGEYILETDNFTAPHIFFMIPYLSLLYVIATFSSWLFYKNDMKYGNDYIYENHLGKDGNPVFIIFIVINIAFAVVLSI